MIFQPILPTGGLAGWRFLDRTYDRQMESYQNAALIKRETDHFRDKIASITTAAELVSDKQLLKVALGAFGLEGDADKGYFIRRVLEEGTINPDSIANRLVDKRYVELSDAFGFGSPFGARTGRAAFAETIVSAYQKHSFEVAVGEKDNAMRLALTFRREIADLAEKATSGDTAWYSVLGNPPLRSVFEKAFNLPSEFASIDIDQQVKTLKTKARQQFGSSEIAAFADPAKVEKLIDRFLVRSQIETVNVGLAGASAALALLQNAQSPTLGSGTLEAIFSANY